MTMPVRNNGLKGYIYRDAKDVKQPPVTRWNDQIRGWEAFDVEGSHFTYRYDPSRGKTNDPRAFVNLDGESIMDLYERSYRIDRWKGPTKKSREYLTKGFRDTQSFVDQFNDLCFAKIRVVSSSEIVADHWKKDRESREEYARDIIPYIDYRKGEIYRGVIVDDPAFDTNITQVEWVDTRESIPMAGTRIHKEYEKPMIGETDAIYYLERGMQDELKRSRGRHERRYRVDYIYDNYELTEDQIRSLGIDNPMGDWEIDRGETFTNKGGVKISVVRTKNRKNSKAVAKKAPVRKPARRIKRSR